MQHFECMRYVNHVEFYVTKCAVQFFFLCVRRVPSNFSSRMSFEHPLSLIQAK